MSIAQGTIQTRLFKVLQHLINMAAASNLGTASNESKKPLAQGHVPDYTDLSQSKSKTWMSPKLQATTKRSR
jgi:hypothetical protein